MNVTNQEQSNQLWPSLFSERRDRPILSDSKHTSHQKWNWTELVLEINETELCGHNETKI